LRRVRPLGGLRSDGRGHRGERHGPDPFPLLGAFGAALGEGGWTCSPAAERVRFRDLPGVPGAAAIAALALGIAWPSAVAWKTKSELRRLDAQVSALRPAAERYEEALSDLDDAQERIAALREEASATGETLRILRELTDRLPNGTWLLSLRVEGGRSTSRAIPSASEIFPALTRDGRFRAVEFGAPITRQADNIERFKIRGEFVAPPPAPASPAAGAVR